MSIDIEYIKVPVFEDVNDRPVEPTASNPGNGSHLIDRHNELVNIVQSEVGDIQDALDDIWRDLEGRWIVVNDSYAPLPGQRVVMDINNDSPVKSVYELSLPSNPPIGTQISYVCTNAQATIDITDFNSINSTNYYTRVYTQDSLVFRTLVYVGSMQGWCTVTGMNYQTTVEAN